MPRHEIGRATLFAVVASFWVLAASAHPNGITGIAVSNLSDANEAITPVGEARRVAYQITFTIDDPFAVGYSLDVDSALRGYLTESFGSGHRIDVRGARQARALRRRHGRARSGPGLPLDGRGCHPR